MNNFKKLIMTLWFPIIASNLQNDNSTSVTNLMEKIVNIKGEIKDEYFDISPKSAEKPNFNEDKEVIGSKLDNSNLKTEQVGRISNKKYIKSKKHGRHHYKSVSKERKFNGENSSSKNYLNNNENEGEVLRKIDKVGKSKNNEKDLSDNNRSSLKNVKVEKDSYNSDLNENANLKISLNGTRKAPEFSFSDSNKDKNKAEIIHHDIVSNYNNNDQRKYELMKIGKPSKVKYFTCYINREDVKDDPMDRLNMVTEETPVAEAALLRHALSEYKGDDVARYENDDDDTNSYDNRYFAYEISTSLQPPITLLNNQKTTLINKGAPSLMLTKSTVFEYSDNNSRAFTSSSNTTAMNQKTMVLNTNIPTSTSTFNVTKEKVIILSNRSTSETTVTGTRPTLFIINSKSTTNPLSTLKNFANINAATEITKCTKKPATHTKCPKPTTVKHIKSTTKCLKPITTYRTTKLTTKCIKPTTKHTTKCPKPTTKLTKPTTKCTKPITTTKCKTPKSMCTKLITAKCTPTKCKITSKYRGTKRVKWLISTKRRDNKTIKQEENDEIIKHDIRRKYRLHATSAKGCNNRKSVSEIHPLNELQTQLEKSRSDEKRSVKLDDEMRKTFDVSNNDEFYVVNRPYYTFRQSDLNNFAKNNICKRTNKDSEILLELKKGKQQANENKNFINSVANQKYRTKIKLIPETRFASVDKEQNTDDIFIENVTKCCVEEKTFLYENLDSIQNTTNESNNNNNNRRYGKKPNFQLLNITQVFNMYSKLLPVKKYLETLHKHHLVRNYFQNDINEDIKGDKKSNYRKIIEIIANNEWPSQNGLKNKKLSSKNDENKNIIRPTVANYQQIEEYFRTLTNNKHENTNTDLLEKVEENENQEPTAIYHKIEQYIRTISSNDKNTIDIENDSNEQTERYQRLDTMSNDEQRTNEFNSKNIETKTTPQSINNNKKTINNEENIKQYNLLKEKLKISLENLTNINNPVIKRKLYQSMLIGPQSIKDRANFRNNNNNNYKSNKNSKANFHQPADYKALVTLKDMLRNNIYNYNKAKSIDEDLGKLKYKHRWNYKCKYR